MATERQVVSVSLSQKQSEFLKNRPEGQSAYLQHLIDDQINKSSIERTGLPILPDELEAFIFAHLDTNHVVKDSDLDLLTDHGKHYVENRLGIKTDEYGNVYAQELTIAQIDNTTGINSWITATLDKIHQPVIQRGYLRISVYILARLRPLNSCMYIETKSDVHTYLVKDTSLLIKAFDNAATRLYPEQTKPKDVGLAKEIDNMSDPIRRTRFNVDFISPNEKSPWVAFQDILSLYVKQVDFGETDITITFIDTGDIAMYRYPKTIGGLVTLDINTYDWQNGEYADRMRYNCWVDPSVQPIRSALSYGEPGEKYNSTQVTFNILESGPVDELAPVTQTEFDTVMYEDKYDTKDSRTGVDLAMATYNWIRANGTRSLDIIAIRAKLYGDTSEWAKIADQQTEVYWAANQDRAKRHEQLAQVESVRTVLDEIMAKIFASTETIYAFSLSITADDMPDKAQHVLRRYFYHDTLKSLLPLELLKQYTEYMLIHGRIFLNVVRDDAGHVVQLDLLPAENMICVVHDNNLVYYRQLLDRPDKYVEYSNMDIIYMSMGLFGTGGINDAKSKLDDLDSIDASVSLILSMRAYISRILERLFLTVLYSHTDVDDDLKRDDIYYVDFPALDGKYSNDEETLTAAPKHIRSDERPPFLYAVQV